MSEEYNDEELTRIFKDIGLGIEANFKKIAELEHNFIEKNKGLNQTLVSDNSKLRDKINVDIKKHDKDIVELRKEIAELKKQFANLEELALATDQDNHTLREVLLKHLNWHVFPDKTISIADQQIMLEGEKERETVVQTVPNRGDASVKLQKESLQIKAPSHSKPDQPIDLSRRCCECGTELNIEPTVDPLCESCYNKRMERESDSKPDQPCNHAWCETLDNKQICSFCGLIRESDYKGEQSVRKEVEAGVKKINPLTDSKPSKIKCPKCNSTNITIKKHPFHISFFCDKCNYTWTNVDNKKSNSKSSDDEPKHCGTCNDFKGYIDSGKTILCKYNEECKPPEYPNWNPKESDDEKYDCNDCQRKIWGCASAKNNKLCANWLPDYTVAEEWIKRKEGTKDVLVHLGIGEIVVAKDDMQKIKNISNNLHLLGAASVNFDENDDETSWIKAEDLYNILIKFDQIIERYEKD